MENKHIKMQVFEYIHIVSAFLFFDYKNIHIQYLHTLVFWVNRFRDKKIQIAKNK